MKKLSLFGLLMFGLNAAYAGVDSSKSMTVAVPERGPFDKGGYEFNVTAGYLASPVIACKGRPTFNYVQGDVSLGYMLSSPAPLFGCEWLRGNWEVVGNLFGVGVAQGPSGFMAGGRVLLRYNYVQPESRWVPFCQIGAGGLGNNVYEHRDQRLIGSGFEFTLVADAGIRYFITPKWAAVLMADFEHISNANTAARNVGVNAAGGMVGLGYFF